MHHARHKNDSDYIRFSFELLLWRGFCNGLVFCCVLHAVDGILYGLLDFVHLFLDFLADFLRNCSNLLTQLLDSGDSRRSTVLDCVKLVKGFMILLVGNELLDLGDGVAHGLDLSIHDIRLLHPTVDFLLRDIRIVCADDSKRGSA